MKTMCYRIVYYLLLLALLLLIPFAAAQVEYEHEPLLNSNEDVLISFAMQKSSKILTVAAAKDESYIVYRFGRKNNIELEYPNKSTDATNSWERFTHTLHCRGVGEASLALEMNYLEFSNYGYTYRIYDAYSAEFSKSFVGIIVIEHATGKEYDIQAIPESKLGGLDNLNAYHMIQVNAAF